MPPPVPVKPARNPTTAPRHDTEPERRVGDLAP